MQNNLVLIKKINDKIYRIITSKFYNYHDELGGNTITDPIPTFREAYVRIQVKKRFLYFISYWRNIKLYYCKNEKTIRLQEHNALIWFHKNIK